MKFGTDLFFGLENRSVPIFLVLALASPAVGQEAPPPARVIEEIVVTAQKTEQSLQDVPISVTAIDGDFVAEAGLTSLVDIVQYAPNVQFYEGQSLFASFNIRGFATPPLGFGLEPSVGLVIDDVAYGRSTYAQDGVFDLERLEVLRGPQGTLFGRNTVAGVMNMTTAEPSYEPNGNLTLGVGSLDERRLEGGVSFPLVDDVLAARFAFRAQGTKLDVYNTTRDEENDVDDLAARLKLLWEPSSNVSFHLTTWTSEQDVHGALVQLAQATPRALEVFRELDPATEADEFDGRTSIDQRTESGRRVYAIAPKAVWSIGTLGPVSDFEVSAIGAWSKIDNPYVLDPDFSPITLGRISADGVSRYEQLSLELRATGTTPAPFGFGEGLDFLVGAYADKIDAAVRQRFDVDLNGALAYLAAGAKSEPSDVENLVPGLPPELFAFLDEITGASSLPDVLT
ncbi:MAG: TonB-dependent receptor, partial [Candidatus Binatia bacterium]